MSTIHGNRQASRLAGDVLSSIVGPRIQPAILCFSHLRWDFVFQRPQHLMSRFARTSLVVYFEEPMFGAAAPRLDRRRCPETGVVVATPHLPGSAHEPWHGIARALLDEMIAGASELERPVLWYYTPLMLPFTHHVEAAAVVYDCMDELANFKFAPPELAAREHELLARADVVFTGGYSLFEAKRDRHANIHPFPSSVDVPHFRKARAACADPADQAHLPHPRLGYYGVIDERMDLDLLATVADAHPEWSVVIVGPVVKIDPATLPQRANLHYLGGKRYDELPAYLSGWDAALMPFAINEATRFISPTKTPEYLAGGCPVVSTPITDVVRHYGGLQALHIGDTPASFVAGCERALALAQSPAEWLGEADRELATQSWDRTYEQMNAHIARVRRPATVSIDVRRASQRSTRSAGRAKPYDDLIVGAGFAGSVMADRLARGSNRRVLVIDRRPHIAGNAFDHLDEAGVLIHKYGPHIFHTNSEEIFQYLSRFTKWRPYEHRVLSSVDDTLVPIPINRTTLNVVYGLDLQTDDDAAAFLASRAETVPSIETSEDVVVAAVGRDLYERFFRGYTRKQWGLDPSELHRSVTSRVPTRTNTDDRYFGDRFQAMPRAGYTRMFEAMLDHPNITVNLGVDFEDVRDERIATRTIYSGPIDEYFGYRLGRLPYRSLRFEHSTVDSEWHQPVAVVNYPAEEVPFTRVTEYKHLTGQLHPRTSITHEYPAESGDPYYPIPRPENQALYKRYEDLAGQTSGVVFIGRLGTYRYYNMDQVVGQALATWRRLEHHDAHTAAEVAVVVSARARA